jgi:hypothetical protein
MDFGGKRRIGAADLAGAEAGGYVRATLSLPILKEQQICRGCLVIHTLQRTTQCFGTRTLLVSAIASHWHSLPQDRTGS